MTIYLINAPILTSFGKYAYSEIDAVEAKRIISEADDVVSAVGHKSTAELMTAILDMDIPMNRIRIEMKPGDKAVVFWLLERQPEGVVLSLDELKALPYKLGLIEHLGE